MPVRRGQRDSQLAIISARLNLQAGVLAAEPENPNTAAEALKDLGGSGLFPGGVFILDASGHALASDPALTGADAETPAVSRTVQLAVQSGARQTGDLRRRRTDPCGLCC